MTYVNPNTFDVLPYPCNINVTSFDHWHELCAWCNRHIGEQGRDWEFSNATMQYPRVWWFRCLQDATLFTLAWT